MMHATKALVLYLLLVFAASSPVLQSSWTVANPEEVDAESASLSLANRLAELSKSGEAVVHKEYREDTQTVSTNQDGQYVVHVDTVIGSQDGDQPPTITNSQDDFIVPIVDSETIYDEEWLNKMWQEMWDHPDAELNELNPWIFPADDDVVWNEDYVHYVPPLEWKDDKRYDDEWKLADYIPFDPLPPSYDEVDRILSDEDNYRVPDVVRDDGGYPEWDGVRDYAPYRYDDYYDVMQWNDDTAEWEINPNRFEEKYGIPAVVEEEEGGTFKDALNWDIEALKGDLEAMGKKEEEKVMESAPVPSTQDLVSIDPETGALSVDQEAYYQRFGVYPHFEGEQNAEIEMVEADGDGDYDWSPPKYGQYGQYKYPERKYEWKDPNWNSKRYPSRWHTDIPMAEWRARQPVAAVAA